MMFKQKKDYFSFGKTVLYCLLLQQPYIFDYLMGRPEEKGQLHGHQKAQTWHH